MDLDMFNITHLIIALPNILTYTRSGKNWYSGIPIQFEQFEQFEHILFHQWINGWTMETWHL